MGRFQITKNQHGNITFSGLCLLFILCTIGLGVIKLKIHNLKATKDKTKQFLCVKEYTGSLKEHFKKIQKINRYIKSLNHSKNASLFLPGYGLVARSAFKNIENILIKSQNIIHISYLKYLRGLNKKGCSFSAQIYKTPFRHRGFSLKRNHFNEAIAREKKWSSYIISSSVTLKIVQQKQKSIVTKVF